MRGRSFAHVLIDADNPPDPHCKAVGDLDGDGRVDLLAAGAAGGGVCWYRNPAWSKHQIAPGSYTTDMTVADVDGDGFPDVIVPESRVGLLWFQNPRARGEDPARGAWKAFLIGVGGAHMHDVEAADLDGDGELEIVTRHQSGFGSLKGNRIYLWKRTAADEWGMSTFDCPHGEGLELGDVDGDGLPDVIIGGRWYRNPGSVLSGDWEEQLFVPQEEFDRGWTRGDVMVAACDLDGDGELEIVLSPSEGSGRLSWFDRGGTSGADTWVEHVLEHTDHVHGLAVGDVDGDGRPDIVFAKMHQASSPQDVAVYFNPGILDSRGASPGVSPAASRAAETTWDRLVLSRAGSHCVRLVDIRGDGLLSVFGANWNNDSSTRGAIELWLNDPGRA